MYDLEPGAVLAEPDIIMFPPVIEEIDIAHRPLPSWAQRRLPYGL